MSTLSLVKGGLSSKPYVFFDREDTKTWAFRLPNRYGKATGFETAAEAAKIAVLEEGTDDRDTAIKRIRKALKDRSGKSWSVTGGRGTAWGWIRISSPPKRREREYYMSEDDQKELAELLGFEYRPGVNHQGISIAASGDYRREYVARAEGREPTVYGTQYWD